MCFAEEMGKKMEERMVDRTPKKRRKNQRHMVNDESSVVGGWPRLFVNALPKVFFLRVCK